MLSAALAIAIGAQALRPAGAPAVPLEPVAAMVDAFRTHSVVAVTAGHGEVRGYAFAAAAHPRSTNHRRDQRHRRRRGKRPLSGRRRSLSAWREGADRVAAPCVARYDAAGARLRPQWEEFYQALRSINASQPAAHKVRVLLGDPPIDWENVKTAEEHRHWIEMRDTFPADLIQREVIAEGTPGAADLRRRCISSARISTPTTSSKGRRKRL